MKSSHSYSIQVAENSPSCLSAELLANRKSDEDYQNIKEISATSYAGLCCQPMYNSGDADRNL